MPKPSDARRPSAVSAGDASIIAHAARVLGALAPGLHADTALRQYFEYMHRLGPREKRAISRATFVYFRWLQWLDHKAPVQKQIAEALELQRRFDQNPALIKPEALAALAVPAWARDEVAYPPESLRQLQGDPALWIRARAGAASALAEALGDCEPARTSFCETPGAFRYAGKKDLFLTPQFHEGLFEIQDLASQLVAHACAPRAGETWWDACAGEGGKTLHLADLMGNKGLIWASDRSFRRLQVLKRRAARAKVFNYRAAAWDGSARLPVKTKFDGILIDAPCSGAGTWQRNPHARWTTTSGDMQELATVQRNLLEHAVPALKAGGRLVYAVCTLTRTETTAVASAFSVAHPEFEAAPVFQGAANEASQITLWPHELNANGMFIAAWRKK